MDFKPWMCRPIATHRGCITWHLRGRNMDSTTQLPPPHSVTPVQLNCSHTLRMWHPTHSHAYYGPRKVRHIAIRAKCDPCADSLAHAIDDPYNLQPKQIMAKIISPTRTNVVASDWAQSCSAMAAWLFLSPIQKLMAHFIKIFKWYGILNFIFLYNPW